METKEIRDVIGRTVCYNGIDKRRPGFADTSRFKIGNEFVVIDEGTMGIFHMLRLKGVPKPAWAGSFGLRDEG